MTWFGLCIKLVYVLNPINVVLMHTAVVSRPNLDGPDKHR